MGSVPSKESVTWIGQGQCAVPGGIVARGSADLAFCSFTVFLIHPDSSQEATMESPEQEYDDSDEGRKGLQI